MALTAMEIYKNLPKTNCKDCGMPTCMAFAMQVGARQKALTDCPHVSGDAQDKLADASAPPMKLVTVGTGEKKFVFGRETVMFRHEEKFHHRTGIAVRIPADADDDAAAALAAKAGKSVFERVGEKLAVSLCAVMLDGTADPAGRAKLAADKSGLPVILMSTSADTLAAAAAAVKDLRPLLYQAGPANADAVIAAAAEHTLPLAVQADDLEQAAELTKKAKMAGVEEMVLAFAGTEPKAALHNLTASRRAALKKKVRELGYPSMVTLAADSPERETVQAAVFAAKYAGIVVMAGSEPHELLPVLTTVQDVYTDPQVPNTVDGKLYEIGEPDEHSPVLFTTNFALTYFSVAGEVERSRIPAYIAVVDTEGMGVLNAYAGDKMDATKVVKALTDLKVSEKVKHRKLIIPGLVPVFRAEIEDTSEWEEVIIGPETAREIPAFLNSTWK